MPFSVLPLSSLNVGHLDRVDDPLFWAKKRPFPPLADLCYGEIGGDVTASVTPESLTSSNFWGMRTTR